MSSETTPLVGTLITGLKVLETLALAEGDTMGVTEVAKRLRLHKSTVLRLLLTLEDQGYVEQDPVSREFRCRMKLFQLGAAIMNRLDLVQVARSVLRQLAELSGETVHLAVLDEGEVVYIEKVESQQHAIAMYSRVGRRSPAHCTGVGKALIAFLPEPELDQLIQERGLRRYTDNTLTDPAAVKAHLAEVREQGYVFDNEEHEVGIRCVAAPIRNHTGAIVASLSIAAPVVRFTPERVQELVQPVLDAARRVSEGLGYLPRPEPDPESD